MHRIPFVMHVTAKSSSHRQKEYTEIRGSAALVTVAALALVTALTLFATLTPAILHHEPLN